MIYFVGLLVLVLIGLFIKEALFHYNEFSELVKAKTEESIKQGSYTKEIKRDGK